MSGSTNANAPAHAAGEDHPAAGGTAARLEDEASLPGLDGSQVPVPPCHHGHDLGHWPLRDVLILRATPDAVPSARAHLRQLLSEWGRVELGPDASVVLSELITNAVLASAQLPATVARVLVALVSDSHWLLVVVADASPRPPVRVNLGPDTERGRGLALVEAFTSRWGWQPVNVAGLVKAVWAEWHLPTRVGQRPAGDLLNCCHAV